MCNRSAPLVSRRLVRTLRGGRRQHCQPISANRLAISVTSRTRSSRCGHIGGEDRRNDPSGACRTESTFCARKRLQRQLIPLRISLQYCAPVPPPAETYELAQKLPNLSDDPPVGTSIGMGFLAWICVGRSKPNQYNPATPSTICVNGTFSCGHLIPCLAWS
jgi:hypothetical protein